MFSYFGSASSFFIMPACYHPTTLMFVDDDADFLKYLSMSLGKKYCNIQFTSVDAALQHIQNNYNCNLFTERCLIDKGTESTLGFQSLRNEMYNKQRFAEILITVVDYDMPDKNGIDLINTMEFPPEIQSHAFIMLTGQISSSDDMRIAGQRVANDFISKADSDFVEQLKNLSNTKCKNIFQWASYIPAKILAKDPTEQATFLFDKNCAHLIDDYVAKNNICELYLYDKQGSYVFLDADANLSWFIIRNETGINNNLKFAKQHSAPKDVIEAISSREYILSIYTENDTDNIKQIDWHDHLIKAKRFTTSEEYIERFEHSKDLNYYYAFTDKIPSHNIKLDKILSFNDYLKQKKA